MEDLVTFKQAVELKKLGFNWECTNYYLGHNQQLREWDCKVLDSQHIKWDYNYTEYIIGLPDDLENLFEDDYSAPTLFQVQRWLYKKYGIWINVERDMCKTAAFNSAVTRMGDKNRTWYLWFDSPIEALSKGIDKAIELIKNL